jgi:hypothetical protein
MVATPINSGFEVASPYLERPLRSEVQARINMGLCPWGAVVEVPDIPADRPCPVCGATEADAGKPGWTCKRGQY